MKPSKILLASVFLTAIIIVVIGAVTRIVLASSSSNNAAPSADTVQVYQQREAAYKQLIQQANQQIEEANARLQAAGPAAGDATGPAASTATGAAAASNAPANVAVSADKAEQVARQAADPGQLLVKPPELVNFQGKVAYEVAFQKGSIYIDAQTGAVLFNGTVPQTITLDKAAQIAANYLNDNNILQADRITFRNAPLYRVIFKSGMMVYLDTTGQITYLLKSSSKVVVVDSGGNSSSGPAASSQPSRSSGGYEGDGGNAGGDN